MRTKSPKIKHAQDFANSLEHFLDIFYTKYGVYPPENELLMLLIEAIGNTTPKKNNRHLHADQELPILLKLMPFTSSYNGVFWKVMDLEFVEVEDYSMHNLFMGLLDDRFYSIVPEAHLAEKQKLMVPTMFIPTKPNLLYARK